MWQIIKKQFYQQNKGDTIVEVMVVLAILGLAIGIAYATANQSLLDSRQANQNSQATDLLQSQVENLRVLAPNPSSDSTGYIFNFTTGQYFCINASNQVTAPLTSSPPTPNPCQFYVFGNSIPTQVLISYQPSSDPSVTGGTFNLQASWPNISGQGEDTVTLSYRLYNND